MGEWHVENGTEMSDYDFPYWHAEKVLRREDMPFDFKYNNGETHIPMYKHMMVQKGKIFYLNGEVVL